MIKKHTHIMTAILIFGTFITNAHAGSIGLDAVSYDGSTGQIIVTVAYDFTDSNIAGGGLDLSYDTGALAFVTYEQAPLQPDAWIPGSPVGSLDSPGLYGGFGISANKLQIVFGGITSAGTIGTFVFDVLGTTDTSATACGMTLCLTQTNVNPWTEVNGIDVGDELLANGISGADVLAPVPVPAAIYLFLGGLGWPLRFGRVSRQV